MLWVENPLETPLHLSYPHLALILSLFIISLSFTLSPFPSLFVSIVLSHSERLGPICVYVPVLVGVDLMHTMQVSTQIHYIPIS